ncbi:molybdenum ABC transporter ATP-binding protein [Corallincola luteus]|uniref:Molybdenum ABC transporter ATP-binding protein n=1 Tax=Corallincola luteus TaxID=1775177 RepID=A0ABY2APL7_9GAMM|nr:molybdenum ABC transporter ATP-binding protein [Corallincola luteus]TCI04854.1 molybdenum ABC transporter ATP-binding protein [Corallincola luteus]
MISFSYINQTTEASGLKEVQLAESGLCGVFGRSGAGKTTLLRWLAGLIEKEGTIEAFGAVWQGLSGSLRVEARQVGYVPQESALFSHLTVAGNLALAKPFANRAVVEKAELLDVLMLEPLLDKPVTELSGGERQRVALARALLVNPRWLLLDEPLSAVDQVHRRVIGHYLKQLSARLPILLVSHSEQELGALCDNILLMDEGCLRAQGSPSELFSRPDLQISHRDSAASLLLAQMMEYDPVHHTQHLMVDGQPLEIPADKAVVTAAGETLPLRLMCRDIILSRDTLQGTSLRNGFSVTVIGIHSTAESQVLVRLQLAEQKLLARITERSAEELKIKLGDPIYAYVKAVSLVTSADVASLPAR